jgi:HEAT repeat protein
MWRRRSNPTLDEKRRDVVAVAPPSFEALTSALGTRDPQARAITWRILLAADDPRVVPLAREALLESEAPVVIAAIECLVRHGDGDAVPVLIELLSRPDVFERFGSEAENVRGKAAWALGELGDPVAVLALRDAAGQGKHLFYIAAKALVALGPRATDAVAALLTESPQEVHLAFGVLSQLGAPAAPCLREIVRHGNPIVRRRCSAVLAHSGFGTPDLIPELVLALDDPVEVVRTCAADGLAQIAAVTPDPQLRQALPRLRKLGTFWQLKPDDPRRYAEALRRIVKALEPTGRLPLPSTAPDNTANALPRPAENPVPEGPLPIPTLPKTE